MVKGITDVQDLSVLNVGDVLLHRNEGLIAAIIRFFDDAEVNHASLYMGLIEGVPKIGEATAKGVVTSNAVEAIIGSTRVYARRLVDVPQSMDPVSRRALSYVDAGHGYAFEQLLLLAFLSLTRKLVLTPVLGWLLRLILDQAAEFLIRMLQIGRKKPMICSEFVYRCYDEALPGDNDPYTLHINEFPGSAFLSYSQGAPLGRELPIGFHRDSLLAAYLSQVRAEQMPEPVSAQVPPMTLDAAIATYLDEAQSASGNGVKWTEVIHGTAALGSVTAFADAYYRLDAALCGVPWENAESRWVSRDGLPKCIGYLCETVASFVTPGDLKTCRDLRQVAEFPRL
jgi:hypothetical protein